jgi:hypothetical protein
VRIPELIFEFSVSEGLQGLFGSARLWNRHGRTAMREELEKHHKTRIPLHFRLGARGIWNYHKRTRETENIKQSRWRKPPTLDLVRSGRSSKAMIANASIKFKGAIGAPGGPGELLGILQMRWPFFMFPAKPGRIGPAEMEQEIIATTDAEKTAIAEGYLARLTNEINKYHGPMHRIRRRHL